MSVDRWVDLKPAAVGVGKSSLTGVTVGAANDCLVKRRRGADVGVLELSEPG